MISHSIRSSFLPECFSFIRFKLSMAGSTPIYCISTTQDSRSSTSILNHEFVIRSTTSSTKQPRSALPQLTQCLAGGAERQVIAVSSVCSYLGRHMGHAAVVGTRNRNTCRHSQILRRYRNLRCSRYLPVVYPDSGQILCQASIPWEAQLWSG